MNAAERKHNEEYDRFIKSSTTIGIWFSAIVLAINYGLLLIFSLEII